MGKEKKVKTTYKTSSSPKGVKPPQLQSGNQPKPFSKTNQPTPEQKKAGWDRRREAKRIMDDILGKGEMTLAKFYDKYMEKRINKDGSEGDWQPKSSLKINEIQIIWYVYHSINSITGSMNYIDRHVPMAPREVSGPDGEPLGSGVVDGELDKLGATEFYEG